MVSQLPRSTSDRSDRFANPAEFDDRTVFYRNLGLQHGRTGAPSIAPTIGIISWWAQYTEGYEAGTQIRQDSMEPQTCSDCDQWQKSDRTPNTGYCPLFGEPTGGHEIASDTCKVKFWNRALNPAPSLAAG